MKIREANGLGRQLLDHPLSGVEDVDVEAEQAGLLEAAVVHRVDLEELWIAASRAHRAEDLRGDAPLGHQITVEARCAASGGSF